MSFGIKRPEHYGLGLVAAVLLLTLLAAQQISQLEVPSQRVMGLFYLSFPLTLLLAYLFTAVGRAQGLAARGGQAGWRARAQSWGFAVGHLHAWIDGARLYALLFLVLVGPILLVALVGNIAAAFFRFEVTLIMETYGGEPLWVLPEGERLRLAAEGALTLPEGVARTARFVLGVNQAVSALGYGFFLVCLTRLVPFFFWRSGDQSAATLAHTWAQVRWRTGLTFGIPLAFVLIVLVTSALPRALLAVLFVAFLIVWLWQLARHVGAFKFKEGQDGR